MKLRYPVPRRRGHPGVALAIATPASGRSRQHRCRKPRPGRGRAPRAPGPGRRPYRPGRAVPNTRRRRSRDGFYYDNQTGGVTSFIYNQLGGILISFVPRPTQYNFDWNPAWSVKNC